MNADARNLCDIEGCENAVEMDSEYCPEHNPVSTQVTHTKCIVDGCKNTADINANFLCIVCSQAHKLTLRNINTDVDDVPLSAVQYKLGECDNNATIDDIDNSYQKELGNDPFQIHTEILSKKKNNGCPSYNQSSPMKLPGQNLLDVDHTVNNNSQEIRNTNNLQIAAHGYENLIPAKQSCMYAGCDNIVHNREYCMEHDKEIPTIVCVMKGCRNRTEFIGSPVCLICFQTQKNSWRGSKCNSLVSSHNDVESNLVPRKTGSTLMRDNSTGLGKSGDASINFKAIANSLPPIPVPRCVQNINSKKDIAVGQVIARGAISRGCIDNNIPPIPIPFSSLPPIPLLFNRSNSTPESNPQLTRHLHLSMCRSSPCSSLPSTRNPVPSCKRLSCNIPAGKDGYCSGCSTNVNIIPIPVASTTQPMKTIKNLSKFPYGPPKKICKAVDCKFFVNEGLGGYCSECFMCCNISENIPPSPTHKFPFDMLGMEEDFANQFSFRFESQLCKAGNCEFFGNEDFDGYCSGCYKNESLKKDFSQFMIDKGERFYFCFIIIFTVFSLCFLLVYVCGDCSKSALHLILLLPCLGMSGFGPIPLFIVPSHLIINISILRNRELRTILLFLTKFWTILFSDTMCQKYNPCKNSPKNNVGRE